ncbi:uncharacterized protein LOC141842546 [Curcuma longa]|uniref:uncharacterized protein LOC141842546 n=1 Tax=Curcuma longa TaxID=136217 RepID=UPI003D9F66DE
MDSITSMTPVSRELARESLIAISQTPPEKNLTSDVLPVNSTEVGMANRRVNSEADKYRSKLISISQSQSPDVSPSPAST